MQRASYGQSPPLHHPVPQHVSTVPQLRSPPPPPGSAQSHQQGYGGTPYQQQGGSAGNVFGAYGQFMNDPTAQVAAQFGQTAFKHGQEYVEQNVCTPTSRPPRQLACDARKLQQWRAGVAQGGVGLC